jgi:DNA-binding MarR family transcriptional regulator
MDRYKLSNEGRMRFKRSRISVDIEEKSRITGYEVLDFLFEHGAATMAEIEAHTGLSWSRVADILTSLLHWGYVEKLEEG